METSNPGVSRLKEVDQQAIRVQEIAKIRRAGRVELMLWLLSAAVLYSLGLSFYEAYVVEILSILFTPFGLGAATLFVVPTMFNYVFGLPPLSYMLARRRGLKGPDDVAWILGTPRQESREENGVAHLQHVRSVPTSEDRIETELRRLAAGSELVKNSALKRANVHLFAGAGVGLLGLVAFFAWESSLISAKAPTTFSPWQLAIWKTLLSVPRISMLVVVELMAGFFLRQYRIAMSEYRYFEEIDRVREAVVVSYMIRKSHSDKPALMELANNIERISRHQILTSGETSVILESEKLSTNEFAGTIGRVIDSTKEIASVAVGTKRENKEGAGS